VINVSGIGPTYARKLNQAGIYTCAQLAGLTPERVREIIAPKEWQKFEPEAWIAEARRLAKKTRYAELDKALESLADAQAQPADADTIRQALAVAQAEIDDLKAQLAGVRKERESVINVNGIGPAYERKLNQAGIYTCAQLAELTPERVREIIAPKKWQKLDPEAWIAEARRLAKKK
jgi:predicted flap endonuclease-1-like 5' DNA nuclease